MIFFLNVVLSVFYSFIIGKWVNNKKISVTVFYVLFFPLIVIWLLICGGQNGVGTDYETYLSLFKGESIEHYWDKGEYLFFYIITYANSIGLKGQILFYIFYGFCFSFFFLIAKRLNISYLFIFILLYITVSNLFNNQLNGLRQATATYVGTYGTVLLLEHKRKKFLVWVIIATFIHLSAILFLFLYLFSFLKTIPIIWYKILLLSCFIGGMYFQVGFLNDFVGDFLPINYLAYLQEENIEAKSIIVKITKYIFIPLYWFSLQLIKKRKLSEFHLMLYNIGFFCFCLRLLLLDAGVVSRVAGLYILLSIFPLYYYFEDLYFRHKTYSFLFWSGCLLLFYLLKTVMYPSGEYLYQSIYF